jgi:hypothetical protein
LPVGEKRKKEIPRSGSEKNSPPVALIAAQLP